MKKIILTISLITLIISLIVIIIRNIPVKPFYLDDKYYKEANLKEIDYEELVELTKEKENFGLFIYQPMCLTSSELNKIITEYTNQNQITFYKIPFSKIKDTSLGKKIKYYPSFAIYKNGKIKTYLEANKDEHIEYFSTIKGFNSWFTTYIKLKELKNKNTNYNQIEDENLNQNSEFIELKDVIKENGKVNIYFFWGNGCPHCKEEFAFLNEIEKEYGDIYNLYTYEVWYNEENQKILKQFTNALDIKVEGVPFTIIGNKTFIGFWEDRKEEIKEAIETESKNNFDVYFDKIIKEKSE